MRIVVTGATGFVGRALCARLHADGHAVRAAVRAPGAFLPAGVERAELGPLGAQTRWEEALRGAEAVIHLAARVHVMHDGAADPLAEFRAVNVRATERLAEESARAGVRRLVFVSSVKVHGDESATPCREDSSPDPRDAYGVSKWEAELALARIGARTGLQTVVLRPPLVYGPGVKGNFLEMMRVVARGIPLPLASVENRRSFICLGNLVDALAACATHPAAAGGTFLVGDGEDLSTPELLRRSAEALGVRVRLFPVPRSLLEAAARCTGRSAAFARLCGSLTVDATAIGERLGWRPPFTVTEGLRQTAEWFRGGVGVREW